MPKTTGKRKHDAISDVPYALAEKRTKSANAIFKMNTSIGQHVLKNPGIAQTIVDKADLKQSDVGIADDFIFFILFPKISTSPTIIFHRSYSK